MGVRERYNERKKEQGSAPVSSVGVRERYELNKKYSGVNTDSVNDEFLNAFFTEAGNFLGNTKAEENSYNTWQDLSSRANTIKAWTWKNRELLTEESYKSLNESLSAFDSAGEYWNQFKTPEEYSEYFTEAQSYYDKWGHYADAEDYADKSKYVSTQYGDGKFNAFTGMYLDTGFSDITYDYINRNETARSRQGVNDVATDAAFLGIDKSYLQEMTDSEIGIYNYLYATQGKEAAQEYIVDLTSNLNARQRAKKEEYWRSYAAESPVLASTFSVLTSPLKGLSYVGQTADYLDDGKIDQNAGYNKFSYSNSAIRNEVSSGMGDVGSFLYNTGMSIGDFLLATGITGGNSAAAMAIMGTGAAADTVIASKDMGLSDNQAYLLGTAAGVIEAATEKIGIDAMLDKKLLGESIGKYILKNVLAEGMEEGLSNIGNSAVELIDLAFSGDESKIKREIAAIMQEQGISESEAVGKYVSGKFKELGLDVLGGALSGGAVGGGGVAVNFGINAIDNLTNKKNVKPNTNTSKVDLTEPDTLEKAAMDVVNERNGTQKKPFTFTEAQKATGFGNYGSELVTSLANSEGYTLDQAKKAVETAYLAGFTGMDKSKASFVTEMQEKAFDAGKRDAIMQNTAAKEKAKTATVYGKNSGVIKNEYYEKLSPAEQEMFSVFAEDFGESAEMVNEIVAAVINGKKYTASAEHSDGRIKGSASTEKPVHQWLLHENGHRMEQFATDEWNTLAGALYARAEQLGRRIKMGESAGMEFDSVKNQYNNAGQELSTRGYVGEVVMRELEIIFGSAEEFNAWRAELDAKPQVKTAWAKFMEWLTEILEKIKSIVANRKLSPEARKAAKAEIAEIERIKELYADAYKATRTAVAERTAAMENAKTKQTETKSEQADTTTEPDTLEKAAKDVVDKRNEAQKAKPTPESEFDNVLKLGSGHRDGKQRISEFYSENPSKADAIEFLKKEYGIGGQTITLADGTRGHTMHDAKGLKIDNYKGDVRVFSWSEVDDRLRKLIKSGEYGVKVTSKPTTNKTAKTDKTLFEKYNEIKQKYPNNIVLYRVGDFFEVLGEDAKSVAEWTDLTLTSRNDANAGRIPMVGFPFRVFEVYVEKIRIHQAVTLVNEEDGVVKEISTETAKTAPTTSEKDKGEQTPTPSSKVTTTEQKPSYNEVAEGEIKTKKASRKNAPFNTTETNLLCSSSKLMTFGINGDSYITDGNVVIKADNSALEHIKRAYKTKTNNEVSSVDGARIEALTQNDALGEASKTVEDNITETDRNGKERVKHRRTAVIVGDMAFLYNTKYVDLLSKRSATMKVLSGGNLASTVLAGYDANGDLVGFIMPIRPADGGSVEVDGKQIPYTVNIKKESSATKAKATPKTTKTAPKKEKPKVVETSAKIEDFGEKIGGARKDQWNTRGLLVDDLDGMNERERENNVKKDNVWKRPNYRALVEAGGDRGLLWAVNEIRKSLQQNIFYGYSHNLTAEIKAEKQKLFIETIRAIQAMAENAKTQADFEAMGEKWLLDNGYLEKTPSVYKPYAYTNKFSNNPALYGTNYLNNIRYLAKNFDNLTNLADRNQFAVDAKSVVPKGYSIVGGEGSIGGKLVDGEWVKDTSYAVAKGRYVIKDGFATKEAALEWLKQGLAKKKGKTRFVPEQLLEVHRKGPDYRNSKHVDGQNYIDTFGFKGGEFGNWMSAKDRQVSLDYGFDALKDLADALGIADTDISFNGNLNIAFGARGQGLSGASAHYENERRVINLTKMNGAGSLAHEWFHALDDFIGGYTNNFATDRYHTLPERTKQAIRDLITTMQYKDATQEETDLSAQKRHEQAVRGITNTIEGEFSWVKPIENGTFNEANAKYYKRVPTLEDAKKYRELFGKLIETGEYKYVERLSELRKEVNGRVIPKEVRDSFSWRLIALNSAKSAPIQRARKMTDFYNDSRTFGKLHAKDGDYWDSTVEMSARAFACYIADKTNKQNDYLSAHSDSAVTLDVDRDGNPVIVRAFPVGEERAAINNAFDNLVEALKADGLLHERTQSEKPADVSYSLDEIVDDEGNSYGIGVKLDSTLLDNLTPSERVKMVKEYVKELGGEVFTAYDRNGKAVNVRIAKSNERFKNRAGKNVPVNGDLTSYLGKNETKQEAITLIDELVIAARYSNSEKSKYSHDWLDNYGNNDWDYWTTFVQDKNNTIWEARLNIANTANGEKILYDIVPIIEKSGAVRTSDTSPLDNSISQDTDFVNTQFSDDDSQYSLDDLDEAPSKKTKEFLNAIDDLRNGKKNASDKLVKYVDSGMISTDDYDGLIEKYGAIAEGEKPHREVRVPQKTEEDKKVSQTVRTILEAKATPDEAIPTIEKMVEDGVFSYDVYTDKQAISDADAYIKEYGWEESLRDWLDSVNKGEVSKQITAMGWALYNNAANTAKTATSETERNVAVRTSLEILTAMVQHQRSAAQALQATRILKKLSPETQLYGIQKTASALLKELKAKYGKKAPNLKIDEKLAEDFLNAKTQEERDAVAEEIYKDIGRQMPSDWLDKWNAWRYLAMLGNPRTHIKNVGGNAFFAPVVLTKNLTATAIESIVYRVSGKKTLRGKALITGNKADRALLKAAWCDYANVADRITNGGKYNDSALVNQSIEEGRRIFKFKPLEKARKFNSAALETEDMWFSQPHYAYALAQYCKANNIAPDQIERGTAIAPAREYAIKEAQKATYRDTNAFSHFVSKLGRNNMANKNKVEKAASTVIEGVLPFRKTPANILVRGIEYSPIGLIKGLTYDLYKASKGKITSTEVIDNISAGLTGTGLLAIGALLAAQGLVRGGGAGDKEEKEFMETMGHQAYSLELPNGQSITLDWLAPEALPFFVGVNLWESTKGSDEEVNLSSILSAITNVSDPMLEMSFLQGLNDVFESVGYASSKDTSGLMAILSSAVTSYFTQAFPTIMGQIERTSEENRMTTYTEKDAFLTGDMQYILGKISTKIPLWDYHQIPYIDAWGRKEASGSALKRGFNNFLNPAYTSTIEMSDMEKELLRLFEQTGENSVFPERADKYFTVDGERKDLTADEYVKYATLKGEKSYEAITKLVQSKEYKDLSDSEKVKAIEEAYTYADQKAKSAISNYKPDSWVNAADKLGTNTEDYFTFRANVSAAGDDGTTSKSEVVDIISGMSIDDDDAWILYLSKYDSAGDYYARDNGIAGNVYMDFLKVLNKIDRPTESGKYGTYTQEEAYETIKNLTGLSRQEKAILWQSVNVKWSAKNNPFR